MPIYVFEGKNPAGKKITGEVEAKTTDELYRWFRSNRVTVTSVKKKRKELSFRIGTGISLKEVADFARQLAVMIGAGLPLSQCLSVMSAQVENKRLRAVLKGVSHSVESGSTLADSLQKHKNVFGDLFIHLVEAGELGGVLDVILRRVASYLEKSVVLRRKVKGAMMYPLVVGIVAIVSVLFMLIFIIPVFANLFADFDAELPMPTKIVLILSNVIQKRAIHMVVVIALLVVAYKYATRNDQGKYIRDKILLAMPVFGPVIRKSAVSRFSRTLETLLSSGVAIIEALNITAKSAGNMVIQRTVQRMAERIAGGQTISEPLRECGVFPPMVVQMIAVGEQTGEVDVMLGKVADFYDEEVDAAVQSMTSIIEPIMIVFLGTIVGGMLIAMYLPMFDLVGAVK